MTGVIVEAPHRNAPDAPDSWVKVGFLLGGIGNEESDQLQLALLGPSSLYVLHWLGKDRVTIGRDSPDDKRSVDGKSSEELFRLNPGDTQVVDGLFRFHHLTAEEQAEIESR